MQLQSVQLSNYWMLVSVLVHKIFYLIKSSVVQYCNSLYFLVKRYQSLFVKISDIEIKYNFVLSLIFLMCLDQVEKLRINKELFFKKINLENVL